MKGSFKQLDSLEAIQRVVDFSFGRESEKWLTYDHRENKTGSLSYYKKIGKTQDSTGFQTVHLLAFKDEVKEKNKGKATIEDYLDFTLRKYKLYYPKFKYILLRSKHNRYGNLYILKYGHSRQNNPSMSAVFLLMHKDFGYTIRFQAPKEYFDTFLPEVEKMVNSFTLETN